MRTQVYGLVQKLEEAVLQGAWGQVGTGLGGSAGAGMLYGVFVPVSES